MVWSLIIGNGLTIDAARHCGVDRSPSHPWGWPIMTPYNPDQPLLDVMPKLKEHLNQQGRLSELTVYDALELVVRNTQSRPPFARGEQPSEQDYIHMEACHFLRLAYAWYTEQFDSNHLRSWQWYEWLNQNGPDIETVLSYNYELVFERTMRLAHLGKIYGWTQQNFILPPTCAPISLKYSQHRAKRHDVAMAIEGRRVQARCATSVKKQGIGTIEPITE